MSLRDDLAQTLRINLGLGPQDATRDDDEFITNTVDDLMADLTIHGLIKE